MTGLWGRWPIWGTRSAIKRSATSCTSWPAAGTRTQAHDNLVGIHPDPPGAAGRDRLLHRGGAHAARAGDLLRVVFHPSRQPPGRDGDLHDARAAKAVGSSYSGVNRSSTCKLNRTKKAPNESPIAT